MIAKQRIISGLLILGICCLIALGIGLMVIFPIGSVPFILGAICCLTAIITPLTLLVAFKYKTSQGTIMHSENEQLNTHSTTLENSWGNWFKQITLKLWHASNATNEAIKAEEPPELTQEQESPYLPPLTFEERQKALLQQDYWTVLEVKHFALDKDIRHQVRQILARLHPDSYQRDKKILTSKEEERLAEERSYVMMALKALMECDVPFLRDRLEQNKKFREDIGKLLQEIEEIQEKTAQTNLILTEKDQEIALLKQEIAAVKHNNLLSPPSPNP